MWRHRFLSRRKSNWAGTLHFDYLGLFLEEGWYLQSNGGGGVSAEARRRGETEGGLEKMTVALG